MEVVMKKKQQPIEERNSMKKDRPWKPKEKPLQGWICPKCGSVYAIWVSECGMCKNSNVKITIGTGTDYGSYS